MTQTLITRHDPRGLLAQLSNGTANITAYIPHETLARPGISSIVSGLKPFSEGIEHNSKAFIGDEAHSRNTKLWENTLKKPMRDALQGATVEKVETEEQLKQYAVPPIAGEAESLIRSETRELIRSMKPAQQATTLSKADYRTLAAIVEAPALNSGLSDDLYKTALDRFRLLNLIQKLGIAAEFKNKPVLDTLVATGVNRDAVESEGRAVLATLQKRLDQIKTVEGLLRHLISLSGMATGKTDQEVLDAIA